MKTYRQREKQGAKVSDATKGPDEAKIKVCKHLEGRFHGVCVPPVCVCTY